MITLQDLLYSKKVPKGIILDWYHEPNPDNLTLKQYVEQRNSEDKILRLRNARKDSETISGNAQSEEI